MRNVWSLGGSISLIGGTKDTLILLLCKEDLVVEQGEQGSYFEGGAHEEMQGPQRRLSQG